MNAARLGDRGLWPDLQPIAYLNHAAISPPSLPVRDAVHAAMEDYGSRGLQAHGAAMATAARLKGRLATLIGAKAEDIALVPNTTAGVVDVALCLPWKRGDRVLLLHGEFPTNITPWQQAAAHHDLELCWLQLADFERDVNVGLERFEALLKGGVRLAAISAVQFHTGQAMPLVEMGALCRQYGAQFFVDAIQACGVLPVDVSAMGIDYLACGGHKWLMGPVGTGMLYIAPQRVAALRPAVAGWLSHETPVRFLLEGAGHLRYDRAVRRQADFFESGMANFVGIAGLEAALGLIQELGVGAIFAHVQAYIDGLEQGLLERGFASARRPAAGRSGLLSVRPPAGHEVPALGAALMASGVSCSTPDGWLRFAPHWPNGLGEVPQVLTIMDALLAGQPG